MFWQIVTFHYAARTSPAERNAFESTIDDLPSRIPSMLQVHVGPDESNSESTVYISNFEDREGFETYLDHPAHQPVGVEAERICAHIDRILTART
ncbi:Dabb family protein [Aeromicrobium sp.]|uniref:Dabb family protein n=1 Tax=Aeromicrobium sp. TaxID=1871063 RepID=UPI0030C1A60D